MTPVSSETTSTLAFGTTALCGSVTRPPTAARTSWLHPLFTAAARQATATITNDRISDIRILELIVALLTKPAGRKRAGRRSFWDLPQFRSRLAAGIGNSQ